MLFILKCDILNVERYWSLFQRGDRMARTKARKRKYEISGTITTPDGNKQVNQFCHGYSSREVFHRFIRWFETEHGYPRESCDWLPGKKVFPQPTSDTTLPLFPDS